jgi:diguanylate cyclase (GGDEF)-like protein
MPRTQKRLYKPLWLKWFAFFCLCFSCNAVSEIFVPKLVEADQIKSTNFDSFRTQIHTLEQQVTQMSPFERSYLSLLQAYESVYAGNTQDSIARLSELISSNPESTISFRAKALLINGLILVRRYLDAFNYLEQLISQLPSVEQPMAREQGLMVIAMMYRYVEHFDLSIQYTKQLEAELPRDTAICTAKELRLDALLGARRYDEFKAEFANGLKVCVDNKEILWANNIRVLYAKLLLHENQPQRVLDFLLSHYTEAKTTKYARTVAEFDIVLANSYYELQRYKDAEHHALSVLKFIPENQSSQPRVSALKLLSELAKKRADYLQALEYHEQYMAAFTAYMDDKSAQQMAYHTAHSEILAQNQKIALLDKDNQLLQYEQTALKHQAAFNKLLIIALAILVLGLAFMAYRSFVARQRFKALAEYDDLTAISNRYHFSASAKGALALCEKGQLPAALIVFDLDHFKQINDQHGHAAGDWALRQTVDTCRNFMRNNDVFGRIGGEEFAILLPGCQSDKAHLLADICRDAINTIDTAASGYEFKLSASFGVTSAEISGYHLTKLIEDADTAMYQAKQQGRNKVQFFQG